MAQEGRCAGNARFDSRRLQTWLLAHACLQPGLRQSGVHLSLAGALNDFAMYKRVRRMTELYVSELEDMPEIVN